MFERVLGAGKTERRIFVTTEDVAAWVAELGPVKVPDLAGGALDPTDPSITLVPAGNQIALIDTEDYPLVRGYRWKVSQNGYVSARIQGAGYDCHVLMHRLVMLVGGRSAVDHKRHNKLDNRKSQLRLCTYRQNLHNARLAAHNTSGIKGLRQLPDGRWAGDIESGGKKYRLVRVDQEAVIAWLVKKRVELHGEFACHAAREDMRHLLEKHLSEGDYLGERRVGA